MGDWNDEPPDQGSDLDSRHEYAEPGREHGVTREDPFGRGFDQPESGRPIERLHEDRYSLPYDHWEPSDYVFYSGEGYHREFVEPYKEGAPRHGRPNYVGKGPKGYRRSDERILQDVSDRFLLHPDLDASEIEVTVAEGEVTLKGMVPDRLSKRLAEDLCDGVLGVRQTHNRLRVATAGASIPITSQGQGAPGSTRQSDEPVRVEVVGPESHSGSGALGASDSRGRPAGQEE